MKTPAANNLVVGSSFGILLAAPLLVLIGLAPKSTMMTFIVLGALVVYYLILLAIIFSGKKEHEEE
jgi:ESS family glutamate:Na+ symporter